MRNVLAVLAACLQVFGGQAVADSPSHSLRPVPRQSEPALGSRIAQVGPSHGAENRPKQRFTTASGRMPKGATALRAKPAVATVLASAPPVYRSPRPERRPSGAARRISLRTATAPLVRVASNTPQLSSRPGSICGDSGIRGEVLAPIAGKIAGCGVANPVRVTSVDGVALSQQSIMDCATARTLRSWVSESLKPTVGRRGGGIKSLKVAAHYSCRTRNSQPGAKISEHGKGHAIDIAAFQLKNGDSISVLKGWKNRRDKKMLVSLHSSACRRFGTVLGPNSDRFHRDHFHFDTARYRSGSYCR